MELNPLGYRLFGISAIRSMEAHLKIRKGTLSMRFTSLALEILVGLFRVTEEAEEEESSYVSLPTISLPRERERLVNYPSPRRCGIVAVLSHARRHGFMGTQPLPGGHSRARGRRLFIIPLRMAP